VAVGGNTLLSYSPRNGPPRRVRKWLAWMLVAAAASGAGAYLMPMVVRSCSWIRLERAMVAESPAPGTAVYCKEWAPRGSSEVPLLPHYILTPDTGAQCYTAPAYANMLGRRQLPQSFNRDAVLYCGYRWNERKEKRFLVLVVAARPLLGTNAQTPGPRMIDLYVWMWRPGSLVRADEWIRLRARIVSIELDRTDRIDVYAAQEGPGAEQLSIRYTLNGRIGVLALVMRGDDIDLTTDSLLKETLAERTFVPRESTRAVDGIRR